MNGGKDHYLKGLLRWAFLGSERALPADWGSQLDPEMGRKHLDMGAEIKLDSV